MPINIYLGGGGSGSSPEPQPSPIPSDLTASASDVVKGKTFIGNNQTTETGTIESLANINHTITSINNGTIAFNPDNSGLVNTNTSITLTGEFGNATEADVVAGKTFTNNNGLNVTGTYVPASIDNFEMKTAMQSQNYTKPTITMDLGGVFRIKSIIGRTTSEGNLPIATFQYSTDNSTWQNVPNYDNTDIWDLAIHARYFKATTAGDERINNTIMIGACYATTE